MGLTNNVKARLGEEDLMELYSAYTYAQTAMGEWYNRLSPLSHKADGYAIVGKSLRDAITENMKKPASDRLRYDSREFEEVVKAMEIDNRNATRKRRT